MQPAAGDAGRADGPGIGDARAAREAEKPITGLATLIVPLLVRVVIEPALATPAPPEPPGRVGPA